MKKYVMLDGHTLPGADFHQERGILESNGIECVIAQCETIEDVVAVAGDAECIGNNYFKVNEELLSRLPNLKMVIRYGIGYDVVDVDACTKRGIMLCNLPRFCVEDVATHTMALLLDLCRKNTLYDRMVRKGAWDVGYGYQPHRLRTRVLGLVGFGNIARQFVHYVRPFDMTMIAYDPYLPDAIFKEHGVKRVTLEDLYQQADIISLHVPSTPETYHLINRDSIAKMKDGVMLINTSRGPLVDNDAMTAALKSGKVAAAGLDVLDGEPVSDANFPLFLCENLVINPHTSYNSAESSDDQHTQVAQTAAIYFSGEKPQNIVNKKALGLA